MSGSSTGLQNIHKYILSSVMRTKLIFYLLQRVLFFLFNHAVRIFIANEQTNKNWRLRLCPNTYWLYYHAK